MSGIVLLCLILCQSASSWQDVYEQGLENLRNGDLQSAESCLREAREQFCANTEPANSNNSLCQSTGDFAENESRILKALSLVHTAKALDLQKKYASRNFTVDDWLAYLVIFILFCALLIFLLRHGPSKPDIIANVESWMEKRKLETRDDSAKQFYSALLSLFICAILCGGIFLVCMGGMRLLAHMQKAQDADSGVAPLMECARTEYLQAMKVDGVELVDKPTDQELFLRLQVFLKEGSL